MAKNSNYNVIRLDGANDVDIIMANFKDAIDYYIRRNQFIFYTVNGWPLCGPGISTDGNDSDGYYSVITFKAIVQDDTSAMIESYTVDMPPSFGRLGS